MSDFLYSSEPRSPGELGQHLREIYKGTSIPIQEFHGSWGSVAVTPSLYTGFNAVETANRILIVIGGPMLTFRDNLFLSGTDDTAGTRALLRRIQDEIHWDSDLSGPFAILDIDKTTSVVRCISDLMLFIPIFQFIKNHHVVLGTHVDAVAGAGGRTGCLDDVSIVDFILHNAVTFPYTVFKGILLLDPATVHHYQATQASGVRNCLRTQYWGPREYNPYENINEAATELRVGLEHYVAELTRGMSHIAHFLSAGEDSRTIASLLGNHHPDAYVFLDSINREGRIAQRLADTYGTDLTIGIRSNDHYLDILPEASALIGSGFQYFHAHTLGFHRTYALGHYQAVFGGYAADTHLKGHYLQKNNWYRKLPFVPQLADKKETITKPILNSTFRPELVLEVSERRSKQFNHVKRWRPTSAQEWFHLWPATARKGIGNISSNRRLFRTYEPFLAHDIVRISAQVPIEWKLNRRLFHLALRPHLKRSRHIFTGDGRLPYYPWWINAPVQAARWIPQKIMKRLGLIRGNDGPWNDWAAETDKLWWKQRLATATTKLAYLGTNNVGHKIAMDSLTLEQRINAIQILHHVLRYDGSQDVDV